MDTKFHPQLLEDAAAWLFWTLAAQNGFRPTLDDVLQTDGQSLLDCPDREAIFARYPLGDMPPEKFKSLCDAVAEYAWDCSAREENLIGMIFSEDRLSGRSPSAANIRTENWDLPLTIKGDTLPSYGSLCIRHPLPAVVFADEQPQDGPFRVADTQALGFKMPLWLNPQAAEQISDELWLLTGIFYIPENLALAGRPWTEVIPNSICSYEGIMLQGQKRAERIEFCWHSAGQKTQPVSKVLIDKFKASLLGRLFPGQQS